MTAADISRIECAGTRRVLKLHVAKMFLGERYVLHPARVIRRPRARPPVLNLVTRHA